MPYFHDLRDYLATLERRGKLHRIAAEINKDTELHPLARLQFRGLGEAHRSGFLFEHLTGINGQHYAGRVATSVISPSREVYALALQCEPGSSGAGRRCMCSRPSGPPAATLRRWPGNCAPTASFRVKTSRARFTWPVPSAASPFA